MSFFARIAVDKRGNSIGGLGMTNEESRSEGHEGSRYP